MSKKCFFILIFTSFYILAPANNYFVSPSGSNSRSGTVNSPFKTISYGESRLKAGDTLYVRAGTYNETVSISGISGGTTNKPTVISAYKGEEVIIDGNGFNIGAGSALVRSSNNYTQFIGLTVINSNQSGIMLDRDANYSKISKCVVHDVWETGIYAFGDYCTIEKCTVYNSAMSNSDGIYTPPEVWGGGISCRRTSISPVKYCIIKNCVVHDVWGEGIDMAFADYGIIEDNIIYDIFNPLLYTRNDQHTLIQRNFMFMSKTMGKGSPVGIAHWNEGNYPFINKYNTIINNIVYGCERNLYCYEATEGLIIANNTFVNSTYSSCVQINDRSKMVNCLFENNIVIQDGDLQPIWVEAGSGLTFSNNLFNKSYDRDATGTGDLICDPKLVKIPGPGSGKLNAEYFKLLSTSPAINKGAAIKQVIDDFFGNSRDGIPDIGAHEYGAKDSSVKATEISLTGAGGASTITVDKGTLQLTAVVLPSNTTNKTVTWSVTNDSGQASINSSGVVTAISNGTVNATATANDGSEVYSTIVITIDISSEALNRMKIYPNPAQNYFYVSMQKPASVPEFLKIANLSGNLLKENRINTDLKEFIIPVDFPNGIYIVQLCSEKQIYDTQKLIISN
jgi:hypothetical protein